MYLLEKFVSSSLLMIIVIEKQKSMIQVTKIAKMAKIFKNF